MGGDFVAQVTAQINSTIHPYTQREEFGKPRLDESLSGGEMSGATRWYVSYGLPVNTRRSIELAYHEGQKNPFGVTGVTAGGERAEQRISNCAEACQILEDIIESIPAQISEAEAALKRVA